MMRLTPEQQHRIREIATAMLGPDASVRLFGSRTNPNARGGDIDLYFETPHTLPHRVRVECSLYAKLIMALGDRKIDVLLKDARTHDLPIYQAARREGVLL